MGIILKILFSILNAVVVVITLIVIAGIIILYLLSKFKGEKRSNIRLKNVKKVVLSINSLVEDTANSFEGTSFYKFKDALENLSKEKNIEKLIIDIDNTKFTRVQIEELEDIFTRISKNIEIISLGTYYDNNDYLLALNGNKIYMYNSYSSSFSLSYINAKIPYLKLLFDKIGIKFNVLHIGEYKSAGENYHKDKMSNEQRESLTRLFEGIYSRFISKIKEKRNVDVYDLIINGDALFINYKKAKELGFIDGVSNFDKLEIDYSKDTISFTDYMNEYKKEKNKSKNIIAVISATGIITDQKSNKPYISYENMLDKIEQVQDIENLKGVILRVNSPGGSALESEKIYKELKNIKVPIFVSMGDVCASGGYYISSVSRKLYANPTTLTGSIGVVSMMFNFNEALDRFGINMEVVSKSKNTDLFDPRLPMSESSKEKIISSMNDIYFEFKNHVMNARIMTDKTLEPLAGGRVWLGTEGLENGLIDKIGSFDDAVNGLVEYLRLDDYKLEYIETTVSLKDRIKGLKPSLISAEIEDALKFMINNSNKLMFYEEIEI